MLLALIAALAAQSTTTCTTDYFGTVRCTNSAPAPSAPLDYGAIIRNGMNSVPVYTPPPPPSEAEQALYTRRKVGRLIAKGQCGKAEKAALEGGDFELAMQVKAYCAK